MTVTARPAGERLIRMKEVLARVPFGRSTIYTRVAKGTFPRPLDLGGGVIAWRESDIDAWIENLPECGRNSSALSNTDGDDKEGGHGR